MAPYFGCFGAADLAQRYSEDALPSVATMSMEIDILPIADTNEETARLADDIDGVDLETSVLPGGWRGRVVRVQNENTAAVGGEPVFTGWCLDKEDLCVAKLCAFRNKDQDFVRALLEADLVDSRIIAAQLSTVPAR